jgi:hypothetical protein
MVLTTNIRVGPLAQLAAVLPRHADGRNCLYGAFQSQADFTSPISYTVVREQLLVARRPTVIG